MDMVPICQRGMLRIVRLCSLFETSHARIVHNDINRGEGFCARQPIAFFCDIQPERLPTQLIGNSFGRCRVLVSGNDLSAFSSEGPRDCLSNTAPGTGDQAQFPI